MSLALARKYRPKRFADVAVQTHVATTLKGAIARGRVAHGYLLCGPRGVGKTTLARVLAMALNCERRGIDGEPCGECVSCRHIWSGAASLDVVEIDAASNRGVDDARDLRERAMYAPSGDDRYKVYIVDEAHMLTREAWNALLKILEEPPPRVVFVFATTDPQKIAQSAMPVLSRLQRFEFKRIGAPEIRERLTAVMSAEAIGIEPEALAAIARAADGSMRDALSLTDQVLAVGDGTITAERVREALGLVPEDEFIGILDLIADRRAADVFPAVGRLAEAGIDFAGFLTGLADMLRSQLAVVLGSAPDQVSERAREALVARRARFTVADLLRMLQSILELEPRFRKSGQQQLLVETLLVRFALLDRSIEIEDVLRSLGGQPTTSPSQRAPASRPDSRAESRPQSRSDVRLGSTTSSQMERGTSSSPQAASSPFERPEPVRLADSSAALAQRVPEPAVLAPRPLGESMDVAKLTGRWDALVEHLRRGGKPMLATALGHSAPVTVTASGIVTIELDEPNDIYAHAISNGRGEIVGALREWFRDVERVELRRDDQVPAPTPKRLTEDMVRAERIAALRKRDPVLGAAIDALDLDVAD